MKRAILRLSVGAYLIAFNAALAGLVLAIVVAEIRYDRARTIGEFVREIDNVADVLSDQMRESFGVIDQALLGVAEILAVEEAGGDQRFMHDRLVERQRLTFGTYSYYLLGPDGTVLVSSLTPNPDPADFSSLRSFQVHKENSPGLFIGEPTKGMAGDVTGKWIVHVTRRISDNDGGFAGVVGAVLSLDEMQRALSELNVGPDGAIGFFRADGIMIARNPFKEEIIGRSYTKAPLFTEHLPRQPNGVVPIRYFSDDVLRYTAYRTVEGRPIVVFVAASEADMLAGWAERALVAAAAAILLIALLGAATIIAHRVLRRREAEQRANSERLSKLAEAATEFASITDMDALLRRTTERARALVGCHQAITSVIDGASPAQTIHTVSFSDKYAAWRDHEEQMDAAGVYRLVFERDQPVRLTQAELERHPAWKDFSATADSRPPMRGWLAVPLMAQDGSNLGQIQLSDRNDGEFTEDDEAIMVQLAHVTSVAIENIRLVAREREAGVQLRQAQKMDALGQLTGGVAHDFNNLLTVILGNADLLVEDLEAAPQQRTNAEMIQRAAERAADLTKRLLAFSRRQMLQPAEIEANTLLAGMEGLLRRTLGAHVEVRFSLAPGLWRTLADPSQVEIAILNLAINARDAMSGGGTLTIETGNAELDAVYAEENADVVPGAYVMIAVTDSGTGMASDVLARAVEPFFTTKESGKGSGLGLSMVYGFAKQSAGHLRIYSEEGHGTAVRLYLPRAVGAVTAVPFGLAGEDVPRGSERILLVEDDPLVRSHIESALRDLGYLVTSTTAGREALERLDAGLPVDILVTDVILPGGMSGPMVAAEARRRRAGLKVLYISGYTGDAMQTNGRLAPDSIFLGKPFRREDLARKLREALAA